MNLLISACLLDLPTRYDGTAAVNLREMTQRHTLIPICPEQLGGLPTPRPPCELCSGRALTRDGRDFTAEYEQGARLALDVFKTCGCAAALLKLRSPSCGKGWIYDGSFTRALVPGNGVFADLLLKSGIPVYGEDELQKLGV